MFCAHSTSLVRAGLFQLLKSICHRLVCLSTDGPGWVYSQGSGDHGTIDDVQVWENCLRSRLATIENPAEFVYGTVAVVGPDRTATEGVNGDDFFHSEPFPERQRYVLTLLSWSLVAHLLTKYPQ